MKVHMWVYVHHETVENTTDDSIFYQITQILSDQNPTGLYLLLLLPVHWLHVLFFKLLKCWSSLSVSSSSMVGQSLIVPKGSSVLLVSVRVVAQCTDSLSTAVSHRLSFSTFSHFTDPDERLRPTINHICELILGFLLLHNIKLQL